MTGITYPTVTDDDGSLTVGSVWNAAWNALLETALNAFVQRVTMEVVTLTDGATPALNAALGTVFRLAAAGNRTIAVPSNPTAGQRILIQHFASGGARTLALNTSAGGFRFGSTITGLTATSSGKTDYIEAVYNGTDSFWDVLTYTKGF